MATSTNTSVALFTALGTIVGYLGTEVASESLLERHLWPSRFNNQIDVRTLCAITVLMPMGGPIHKAAISALDRFRLSGLWKGNCRGDMLGTAFYRDTKQSYIVRSRQIKGQMKDARNAFWIRAMGLIRWQNEGESPGAARMPDYETGKAPLEHVKARRPVFVLSLSRAMDVRNMKGVGVVTGDVGGFTFRQLLAIGVSEMTAVLVGIVLAVATQSIFSLWFLAPLVLKFLALVCQVRRVSLNVDPGSRQETVAKAASNETKDQLSDANSSDRTDHSLKSTRETPKGADQAATMEMDIICQAVDFSQGFLLIKGPSSLVLQFFRHYGHPQRHRIGWRGDRIREVIAMVTVILTALLYPTGLIIFVFAPETIQWAWLGYQLYAVIAMHLYRFCDGDSVGTTERWVARELENHQKVCLDGGDGKGVIAKLQTTIVPTVAEGRREVALCIAKFLGESED